MGIGHDVGKKIGISRDFTILEIRELLVKIHSRMLEIDKILEDYNHAIYAGNDAKARLFFLEAEGKVFRASGDFDTMEKNTSGDTYGKIRELGKLIRTLINLFDLELSSPFLESPTANVKNEVNRLLGSVFLLPKASRRR